MTFVSVGRSRSHSAASIPLIQVELHQISGGQNYDKEFSGHDANERPSFTPEQKLLCSSAVSTFAILDAQIPVGFLFPDLS